MPKQPDALRSRSVAEIRADVESHCKREGATIYVGLYTEEVEGLLDIAEAAAALVADKFGYLRERKFYALREAVRRVG